MAIKAMNGFYQEEGCDLVWDRFTTLVQFVPCPRKESCLGAPTNPDVSWGPPVGGGNMTSDGRRSGGSSLTNRTMTTAASLATGYASVDNSTNMTQEEMKLIQATTDFTVGCAKGYVGALCLGCSSGFAKTKSDKSEVRYGSLLQLMIDWA